MEVIIYDGPPSLGSSLWVKQRIGGEVGDTITIISEFIRIKSFLHLTYPNKEVLAVSHAQFLEYIRRAKASGKKAIVFDGSPVTHVALEHLLTGKISTKSRKAAIRYLDEVGETINVVLLKPLTEFQGLERMKKFDTTQVVPFGDSLEIAYREAGCNPTIVEVSTSPYRKLTSPMKGGHFSQQHIHSTNTFGD